MKRALFSLVLLTVVYALVLASFHPWDLAFGAVLSGVLLFSFRRFVFDGRPAPLPGLAGRMLAFWPFALAVVGDTIAGTWRVTKVTLGRTPLEKSGIVAVPIGDRTPVGVAVSALVATISPGEFLVEIDWDEGVMLVHTIDASDPEGVRRSHENFYTKYQRKVFP
ncbi:cation transporter [Rubrobacter marinus]|uniref:Cation transporter n=1 Tax=Rubrobacter marinus TaxID=2653852 RepID=A0A6G8PYU1_9ACTN|nr:Na+/H+ antiporter subunit E [Rubrobacter marinus]QIN79345.1 cation transporter [Rubrobacter marinus]